MRRFFLFFLFFAGSLTSLASFTASAAVRQHALHRAPTPRPRAISKARAQAESLSTPRRVRSAAPRRAQRDRTASARMVRVHAGGRGHRRHHRPHTALAIRRARSHGTEAVRAAARHAAIESAEDQSPNDQTQATASLKLPEQPLHFMNLPPLRGSHESLVRQNQRAEEDGLLRVRDDEDIENLRRLGSLVALPSTGGLRVDDRLPANRRYCRAWTGRFLADLARVHYGRFGTSLQVNSAVRTVEYQRHLLHINGNAAPAEGDIASPHLTGGAVDISKKGLSPSEIAWLRAYLLPLQTAGKIDVEEEFHQACFHVSVYKTYTPGSDPGAPWPAISRHRAAALIASRMR
jgi:hypothetical protein